MKKRLNPVLLAIDFDLTIANSHPFPQIHGFRKGAKKYLTKLLNDGYYIQIWTCRTDRGECKDMTVAAKFLSDNGVHYHQINENHPALCKAFKNDCRKIATDLYIDDKGLWLFGLPAWFWLYWIIRFRTFFLKPNRQILAHCKPEHFI